MGVFLINEHRDNFKCNSTWWARALTLALRYGWEPAGTTDPVVLLEEPTPDEWDGSYEFNNQQLVSTDDARNLSDALGRALADIPRHEVPIPSLQVRPVRPSEFETTPGGCVVMTVTEEDIQAEQREINSGLLEFFSGPEGRGGLSTFISFCRKGAFRIC